MIDQNKITHEWLKKGFSCGVFQDFPDQRREDYIYEVDELFLVVEGDAKNEITGKKFRLRPGEEIFIPAKVVHSVRSIGRRTSRWLYGYKRE